MEDLKEAVKHHKDYMRFTSIADAGEGVLCGNCITCGARGVNIKEHKCNRHMKTMKIKERQSTCEVVVNENKKDINGKPLKKPFNEDDGDDDGEKNYTRREEDGQIFWDDEYSEPCGLTLANELERMYQDIIEKP